MIDGSCLLRLVIDDRVQSPRPKTSARRLHWKVFWLDPARHEVWLFFPAKVYCGQSLLDARRESIIVDYDYSDEIEDYRASPNSLAGRGGLKIRDEIRMIRPGFYLGRAYTNRMFLLELHAVQRRHRQSVAPADFTKGSAIAERLLARRAGAEAIMITLPPPSATERFVQASLWAGLRLFNRFARFGIRQSFNFLLREPNAQLVQFVMNCRRRDEGFKLAGERALPGEEASLDSIVETFASYMRQNYRPGEYQRGGNTKTHGILRAEFIIRDDVPDAYAAGRVRHPAHLPGLGALFRARPGYAGGY